MKLFVANCTKFSQEFLYRVAGVPQIYRVVIPIGGQALIYKDASREDLMKIVDQYEVYGMKSVSELDRTKAFTGLCYQFDREIDMERIMSAVAHNDDALMRQAHESRKIQAAGVSNSIDSKMQGSESSLQGLEMEIVEQPKQGDNSEKMKETIQIAKPGSKAAERGAQRAERGE